MIEFDGIAEEIYLSSDVVIEGAANALVPATQKRLRIALCSDRSSWINVYLPAIIIRSLFDNHEIGWCHDSSHLAGGDLCFYLSYGQIVRSAVLDKYKNNLVVHESDLPHGKGWSPLTWQILEGRTRIPVTLLEAVERVDSGQIYAQKWIDFEGHELLEDLRRNQADASVGLCVDYISKYPSNSSTGKPQVGTETFYSRRRPENSELDPDKSISEQFNLLRVVDNQRYPAYFVKCGRRYVLSIKSGQND